MENKPATEYVNVPVSAIDKLAQRGNGNCALLYLYLLRRGGLYSEVEASNDLGLSVRELRPAMAALAADGLAIPPENKNSSVSYVSPSSAQGTGSVRKEVTLQSREMPEYSNDDVKNRIAPDKNFIALRREVDTILGKPMSDADLTKFYGIYDHLKFAPELILLLVTYCVRLHERLHGPGSRPTMRYICTVAFNWHDDGILSLEQAEEYIKREEDLLNKEKTIAAALGIRDRALSKTEKAYVDSWIRMGFDADAVAIAYDRTVTRTGKMGWGYADSIMKSWHNAGLHTPQQIEEGDSRVSRSGTRSVSGKNGNDSQSSRASSRDDIERMRRYLED